MRLAFAVLVAATFLAGGVVIGVRYGGGWLDRANARIATLGADATTEVSCTRPRGAEMQSGRSLLFVVRRGEQWGVRIANVEDMVAVFDLKGDAEDFATALARTMCPSRLTIQCDDGRYCEGRTFTPRDLS